MRVYDRALSPSEVESEMSTPIASAGTSREAGLVGAYAFDAGSGTVAADASGNENGGTIGGATWTTRGRFGHALRFDGVGELVRVPASPSLKPKGRHDLVSLDPAHRGSIRVRTILHRQTDAYFLTAGGGGREDQVGLLDPARVALVIIAAGWFSVALACGGPSSAGGRRLRYSPAVALFLGGSVVDAALAPSDTLIGPALAAGWCAIAA